MNENNIQKEESKKKSNYDSKYLGIRKEEKEKTDKSKIKETNQVYKIEIWIGKILVKKIKKKDTQKKN
jgi:hypothetical protein